MDDPCCKGVQRWANVLERITHDMYGVVVLGSECKARKTQSRGHPMNVLKGVLTGPWGSVPSASRLFLRLLVKAQVQGRQLQHDPSECQVRGVSHGAGKVV